MKSKTFTSAMAIDKHQPPLFKRAVCFVKTRWLIALLATCIGIPTFAQDTGAPEDTSAVNAVSPPSVTQNCAAMPKTSVAVTNNNELISTTSTAFLNLPPLAVAFTIPGTAATCLEVELEAVTFAPSGGLITMRVLLDGTTELLPNQPQWSGADTTFATAHSANFYAFGVPPGFHTVTAQWRSFTGSTVFAHWRSIGVHHK